MLTVGPGTRSICKESFCGWSALVQGAVTLTITLPFPMLFYFVRFVWNWNHGSHWLTAQAPTSFTVAFAVPAPAGAEVIWDVQY